MAKLELLSRTIYDADGTQTVWDFNFASGYLLPEHVKAYYELASIRTNVTVTPSMLIGPNQLRITPAVPAGAVLTIYRDTPKNAPLVDFVDRGTVSEVALDTIAKQAVFVAAESADSAATAATDVAVTAAATAQSSALASSINAASASDSALSAAASAASAGTAAASAVNAHKAELASSGGSLLQGHLPSGSGAVPTTTGDYLKFLQGQMAVVSGAPFYAKGDNAADDTAPQQAAISYVQSTYDPALYASNSPANGPSSLFYPAGYYRTNGQLTVTKKVAFKGDGPAEFSSGSRVVQFAPAFDLFRVVPIAQGMSVSFENMTLRGVGTGVGDLIRITRASSGCNSQRYYGLVFGTPPRLALNIEAGDDIIIDNNLFDVSSNSAVAFGTSAALDAVSNVRFTTPAFFAIPGACVLGYNIDGLEITGAQVYPSNPAERTTRFFDGANTLPYKLRSISINGGTFRNVNSLVYATNVEGLKVTNTTCFNFGNGASSTLSGIELTGTNLGVVITGNHFAGDFGTRNFYTDAGAVVQRANITGNTFVNTGGGSGAALSCANTSGVIANNTFVGFSTPSVSEKVATAGNAISPGVIASLGKVTINRTVGGAKQGDRVTVGVTSTGWLVPVGIEVVGFVSAPNTVSIEYRNLTGSSIGVPAHDVSYCVERGV
jgi:hypothetical protein